MSKELKEESKEMENRKFRLKNLISYLGAFLIAVMVILVVTIKDRYDKGTIFQRFHKGSVVENVDNKTVPVVVAKKFKAKVIDTLGINADTLALNDSIISADTVALSAKEIEEELSDILNSAVTIAPPANNASEDSSGVNQ
jgi:hypothetical protein